MELHELEELYLDELNNIDDMENKKDLKNWLTSNNEIYPETSVTVSNSLESGLYDLNFNRNSGKMFLLKKNIEIDEMILVNKKLEEVVNSVSKFTNQKEKYKNAKLIHKRSYLFCGPPGCGKTSHINILIDKLSKECDCIALSLNSDSFWMLKGAIESIRNIEGKDRLIIIIIEDVDDLLTERDESPLTNILDGTVQYESVVYLLTTNSIDKFSPRMLRPSRIDEVYEIMLPNSDDVKMFFEKKDLSEELVTKLTLTSIENKFNMSEVKELFIGTQIQDLSIEEVVDRIKDMASFIKKDNREKSNKVKKSKNINI